jgi:hypothetical protein
MNFDIKQFLDIARRLPAEQLPRFMGALEEVRATALLRLSAPAVAVQHDELLNIREAAGRYGVSTDYLYRHAAQLPFTRRMGRKLLFSSQGMDEYIKRNRPETRGNLSL